jgi:hypothetical protein
MELQVNLLNAALQCAGTKDIRHYLNGVLVDVIDATRYNIVSTDGHVLFAGHGHTDSDNVLLPIGQYLIPSDAIKAALKGYKGANITFDGAGIADKFILGNSLFELNDGKFPDYMRVIPSHDSEERVKTFNQASTYQPELISRATKAVQIAQNIKHPTLIQYGPMNSGVVVGDSRDSFVVIMPFRSTGYTYNGWTR